MTGLLSQFGVVDESTYGTPVTVTRFFEVDGVPVPKADHGRSRSTANRTGSRVERTTTFVPFERGATFPVSMDVPTKGWGWWLKHMLGTVSSGTVVDSNYTHTGTVGTLLGDFFTAQAGVPFVASATVSPFTAQGCKIVSWELSCDLDGLLKFSCEIDSQKLKTATDSGDALASASYASGALVFSFQSAAITVGGTTVDLKNLSVTGANTLDVDRRFLGQTLKDQPVENGERVYAFTAEAEFQALTQLNQYRHATASSTHAALVATYSGPIAHGGTTLPSLVITIPAARFDMVDITGGDQGAGLMQSISGVALDNLSASPITIAYTSTDSTP